MPRRISATPERRSLSDSFIIFAIPRLRQVTPGAKIDYLLLTTDGGPVPSSSVQADWYAINDPKTVSYGRPRKVLGPSGTTRWEEAVWSFTGLHKIVCDVEQDGTTVSVVYEQWVVPLEKALAEGPALREFAEDPKATFEATARLVKVFLAAGVASPPRNDKDRDEFNDRVAQLEAYRDKLELRLESTKNFLRRPFAAQHFDAETQKTKQLLVFISKVGGKEWKIVDWTNPTVQAATGEYSGFGDTPEEGVRNAIEVWDKDNRYPDGAIRLQVKPFADILPAISTSFETDGSAQWDSISAFFGWVGLGAAVVAGIVTLVAPIPGSQLASALIWTSILSGTAAAVVNIGVRANEGFSSFHADLFDVLSIVGNLFGAASLTLVWSRGAMMLVRTEQGLLKGALIGQVLTTGVQGVILGKDFVDRFDKIQNDATLSPHKRTTQLIELFRQAATEGVLIYISVKATKSDLDTINARGVSVEATTPAERLAEMANPNADLDLTKAPKVEGSSSKKEHKTKVQIDQEAEVPHSAGRPRAVRTRTDEEAFKDSFGHGHFRSAQAELSELRARIPETVPLTDNELIALRGYMHNLEKPEFNNQKDFQRINTALRTKDVPQLALLGPYIRFLRSALDKMPKFNGTVGRYMSKVDPAVVRKQFVQGKQWEDLGFLSTSRGGPTDKGQIVVMISGTKSGHVVERVSRFPEREVLFPPGVKFEVLKVIEIDGNTGFFLIMMREL